MTAVLAHDPQRRTNAQAIADVAALGWLHEGMTVLDTTYGLGRFWRQWRPTRLVGADLDTARAPHLAADAVALPFVAGSFDVVVFDPPYALRGTSRLSMDNDYGISAYRPACEVAAVIEAGTVEACRVARRAVLVKVQDQVCSGRMHWQTVDVHIVARRIGWRVADELHVSCPIPQPSGRRQHHARERASTLLVMVPRRDVSR